MSPSSSQAPRIATSPEDPGNTPAPMSQGEVLQALSGLLLGMFVTILSSTVVSTSLPRIISDLGGGQSAFTWVVTATLLSMTVSTPIWGKFADLFDRKLLVQMALGIFVLGSALAGMSQNPETLIAFRLLQGLGAGGLTALVSVLLADIISPRERGKYMDILSAIMSVGQIGGPLLGGTITDAFGWRWNFYVGVPIAIIAVILIQKTLHLPARPQRAVSIDYLGAGFIAGGVSLLLIWVSLAGSQFSWSSTASYLMVFGSMFLLGAAIFVESRAKKPIIPLDLFRNRTFVLSVVASMAIGVTMIGTAVFLSQYMQLARGKSPTETGLFTLPMVIGTLISATVGGQIISRTGVWKRYVLAGAVLLALGVAGMGTLRADTSYVLLSLYLALIGLGMGVAMQNMVLIVQNVVSVRQMGAASSAVAFFRNLGGTVGVSAMGAVLGIRVSTLTSDGLDRAGMTASGAGLSGGIPDLTALSEPARAIVEGAYGEGIGNAFLLTAPLAIIAVVAIALLPNIPLGTLTATEQLAEEQERATKGSAKQSNKTPASAHGSVTAKPSLVRQ